MKDAPSPPTLVRFGAFEVDLRSGELRKKGLKIKLQDQPLQVLAMLLARPGEVVTREELQKALWPADTFVDFDQGLNKTINKIREALGDSADNPRFVETLPRRGYRFVAQADAGAEDIRPAEGARLSAPLRPRWWLLLAALAVIVVSLGVGWFVWHRSWRQGQAAEERIESLAVLPLQNLSRDKDQDYFAEGMTDELITDLGKISALRVISRTSVMQYRGTKKPLPEIARELNVDAVVEGTVLRYGDRVRITAQLIRAVPETHLWADNYERDLRDIMVLQDEVARQIANEIKVKWTPQEHTRLVRARPVNPEAHEAYLKGRYYRDSDDDRLALLYFQQAAEKDPSYAPAYCGLADAYLLLSFFGYMPLDEAYPKWKTATMKALELDDMSAEAHVSLAALRTYHDFDWPNAKVEWERAIDLNPGFVDAHLYFADYLVAMGQFKEAIMEAEHASELDPLSPGVHTQVGDTLYFAGAYDQAMHHLRKALDLDPRLAEAHVRLGEVYAQKGMYQEAEAEFQKALAISGENPRYLAFLGLGYAASGKRAEARRLLLELKGLKSRPFAPSYQTALIHVALGEPNEAIHWLQKSFEERPSDIMDIKVDRRFASLRSDPRFQDLVRRMNFPP